MDDVKIQFHGFSPSSSAVTYFKDLIEEIRNESPTWSTVKATVRRSGHSLKAIVEIRSAAGTFFASASGIHRAQLGRKLLTRIRRQLNKWKSTRFSHETLRHPEQWLKDGKEAGDAANDE